MLMQLILWLELREQIRPQFHPADLSTQFESQARERSKVRAQINQLEALAKQ